MIRCSCQRRPRVRAGRAERDAERVDEGLQLRPPLRHRGRHVGEGLAAARLDLDLGRDQLADEVILERRPLRRRLHLLEAVDEAERDRVEERELLLDRDREVGARVEALPGGGQELLVTEALLVTHAAEGSRTVRAVGARHPPSSSARRWRRGRRRAVPSRSAAGSVSSRASLPASSATSPVVKLASGAVAADTPPRAPRRSRRARSGGRRAAASPPRPPRRRPSRTPRGRSRGRPSRRRARAGGRGGGARGGR